MLKIDFLDISTVNTFMYSYFEIKIHADTLILFMCIYFIFPDGKLSRERGHHRGVAMMQYGKIVTAWSANVS